MARSEHLPGMVLTEHEIEVPLDHERPGGGTLTVFAREIAAPDAGDKPYLLFLQGGPGGESPRPQVPVGGSWLARAMEDFRVLLLDQRGTGLSTPVGTLPGLSPQEQADYLVHFRADSIVRDAELLREHLGVERWSLLGQSFGGFCSLAYLSAFPDSLREVFFTGGIPPVGVPVDDIYAATYARMGELTERYYRRFPEDRDRMRRLAELCDAGEIVLPDGVALTSHRLRTLGSGLGMTGGAEALHFLLERDPTSPMFASEAYESLPFPSAAPIYTVLHEACYADGEATRWSCARVRPSEFDSDATLFTGEHPFPWHLQEVPQLRPLAEAADLLAEHEWPRLYDEDALRSADVPCAAAVYYDDPFVLREFSLATAELIPQMRPWITNEWLHNGIRAGGPDVLDRLIGMTRGTR